MQDFYRRVGIIDMAKIFALLFGLLGGISIGTQSIINSTLGRIVGNIEGTFISFFIGTIAAGILSFTIGRGEITLVTKVPPYLLIGGLLGVIVVMAVITAVQALGATSGMTLVILGQLITVLLIDHFGIFGTPRIPIDWLRATGVILLVVGARLVIR